jgi:hypothetical protein
MNLVPGKASVNGFIAGALAAGWTYDKIKDALRARKALLDKKWTKASKEYIHETRKAFEKEGGARERFWKNEYATNKDAYKPHNQALIEKGKAPFGTDGKPMVLHHKVPIEYGGTNDFSNLIPMRHTDHALKPNFGPLHTPPFPE